jgi:hypothetical protein
MIFKARAAIPAVALAYLTACGASSDGSGTMSGTSDDGSTSSSSTDSATTTLSGDGGTESSASDASTVSSSDGSTTAALDGAEDSSQSSSTDSSASDAGTPDAAVTPDSSVDSSPPDAAHDAATSTEASTTPPACGIEPVDPKATPEAKALLCYLYGQYGNHILTGQQETSWDEGGGTDVSYIVNTTGHYPAILGQDFLYAPDTNGGGAESMGTTPPPTTTTSRAVAWWGSGGISEICYHMGAPGLSDSYNNAKTAVPTGLASVLTTGSTANTAFLRKLDYAAAELLYLQSKNVPVVWRPFHESGGTWFWWSMGTGAQFVQLWEFMFTYFTQTKGIHNLVWMLAYDGTPEASFFPPKAYVDVSGGDTYGTNQPFSQLYSSVKGIAGSAMPLALHETGTIPQPSAAFNGNAAPWILFNTWAGYEQSANTPTTIKSAYTDSHAVTRDKVPDLK